MTEEEPGEHVVDMGEVYGETEMEEPDSTGYVAAESLLPDELAEHEPLSAGERWEAFETALWAYYLAAPRQDVSGALHALEEAVRDGRRPTAAEVRDARRALGQARELVEEHYAELAIDVEPWDGGVGDGIPYGVLREQLEAAGYNIERQS